MNYFFQRLYWRFVWSWAGTKDAWTHEHSFRSWVWANVVSALLAFLLLEGADRALILAVGVLVLAAEAMNTAIERTVDLISEEKSDLARRAKDAGSAAVALTAVAAGVAWLAALFG
ncbi:MAG: diacylglycerol kinase [Pseudomonadota bacterium]